MTAASPPRVLVLYGSETGTAQDVAEQIQQQAWNRQLADTQCATMDDFPIARELPQCSIVVFVVSTTGDGDAPENMRSAWRSLLRKTLAKDWLQGVQIAVFGLGDSSYAKYNAVARRLQARLLQLGANEIIERGLGDDQHALGLFGALNPWLEKLWAAVLLQFPLPEGFVVNDAPRAIEPRYKLEVQPPNSAIAGPATEWLPQSDTSSFYAAPSNALYAERGILKAKLVENRRLTAADWKQDVRHLVFDLGDGDIQYPPGSIAVVYPDNVNGVDELLAYVGLPGNSTVTILAADGSPQFDFPTNTTVRDLFTKYLDIQGTPRRTFFARLSLFASNEEEVRWRDWLPPNGCDHELMMLLIRLQREKLEEIASPEGADLLYDYCIREKKTYVEVLLDFPSVRVPLELLVQFIPLLKPRAYSISSSSLAYPSQLHLTVAIVDFLTPYKRRRGGVCSAFFQTLDPTKNEIYLPLWLKTGLFHPPSIAKDMILIGPGTGLAAMRAIAQERQVLRAGLEDATVAGKTVLFFGSRHQQKVRTQ
jgi:sulfite reductase alpha subunit-like flavoprotein